MDTIWDISAVVAVGVLTAAVLIRHVLRKFQGPRSPECGGGCCGGAKRPTGADGCR
jgi:hypothetical protein